MNELFVFGKTATGLPITAVRFTPDSSKAKSSTSPLLILGGVHGDEVEGVIAAEGLLGSLLESYPYSFSTVIVPIFNVDGFNARTRVNARSVDLNRNLPTQDWNPKLFNERYPPGPHACSEPENQALVDFLKKENPRFVMSLHSFHKYLLNINGNCGSVAQKIHEKTNYPITESMGYPTPGCLGTYAGLENHWPTLTYELEKGMKTESILSLHVPAILESIYELE